MGSCKGLGLLGEDTNFRTTEEQIMIVLPIIINKMISYW